MEFLIKLIILALLLAIIVSLGSGMFFLVKEQDAASKKMVNSLTVRISLSVALFVMLLIAYQMGVIQPHTAIPNQP